MKMGGFRVELLFIGFVIHWKTWISMAVWLKYLPRSLHIFQSFSHNCNFLLKEFEIFFSFIIIATK